MGNKTGKPNLATSLFLTGFLPITAGTCLLTSMDPCYARGHDDGARAFREHGGGRNHGFTATSIDASQNGFTAAFNAHVQRQTTGVDARRFDLDLSSNARNIQLGTKIFGGTNSVTINVGGANQTFGAGDQVTAAEYVAIQQVLGQTDQALNVSAQGTASGGSFSLSTANRAGNLVIPTNVSASNNFANNRAITLSGDLTNLGSIYAMSDSNKVRSGVIRADDINNSGSISTESQRFDLTVVADHNLNNSGSITTSGGLTVATATGSLTNSGSMTAQHGDLNAFAGDGKLTNSGVMSAQANLNLAASQIASDLNINGAGGVFSAGQDINVRDSLYADANNTNLNGGTYLSDNLNLNAGAGTVNAFVDEISGNVNSSGLAAHVLTNKGTLTLGSNCLTGDPTFVNTAGDIIISGGVIARESIAILASGNIIATGTGYISTANSTGATAAPNTDVTLIAGGVVTTTGTSTGTLPGTPIGGGQTATVTFTGGTGGNIDFTASKYTGWLIDTSSNLVGGGGGSNQQRNGGNVLIEAFSTSVDNGFVLFPQGRQSINTSSLYNNSGDVTIIAGNPGGSKTPSIVTGIMNLQVDPNQGGNEGNVTIYAAQPETVAATPVSFNAAGAVTAGNFEVNPLNLTFTNGGIQIAGAVNAGGGDVDIRTQGGITQVTGKIPGRIQGNNVTMVAGINGIGAGAGSKKAANILTEANTLLLTSGSSIFINNLGSVTLGSATVDTTGGNLGTISITTTADAFGNGRISVSNNSVVAASTGILTLVNLVSSGDINGNSGIRTPAAALITATTVTLADNNAVTPTVLGSGFGDIGQAGATTHINVDASFVSANTQGNAFVHSDGTITILDSSAGNQNTFEVIATPDGGGNGQIIVAGTIASTFGRIGTLFLQSSETGAGVGGIIPGGTLVAELVRLRDDDGVGGLGNASLGTAAAPIVIDASALNVDTQGPEINIVNLIKTGMDLQGVAANATRPGSFTLLSASTVHTSGTIFADNSISITAQGAGNIILSNDLNVNGATTAINLTTSSGNIISDGGEAFNSVGANVAGLTVNLLSSSGGVGTDLAPFLMEAGTVNSAVPGYTNIYNQNTTAINMLSTTAKNQFTFTSDGQITVATPILSATGIKIATTSGTAAINLNGSIGSSKVTNVVEIDTAGSGSILTAPGVIIGSKGLVSLSTDTGNIGVPGTAITVSTPGLSANTNTAGQVNITSLPSKKVPLTLFDSGSGGDFALNAQGSVVLNNIQTIDGSISVVTTAGTLSTAQNAIIEIAEPGNRASAGKNILLQNAATKAGKGAAITIGAGTQISTFVNVAKTLGVAGSGSIRIIADTNALPAQTNTTAPTNVLIGTQSGGALTYFGTNSITALAPNNTVDNIGADITFSTGTKPATAIVLGGGVLIHADPPVTGGSFVQPQAMPSVPTASQPAFEPSNLVAAAHPHVTSVMNNSQPAITSSATTTQSMQLIDSDSTFNGFANVAAAQATAQNALNVSSALPRTGWISDTELENGEIPASIVSDGELGIVGDNTANVQVVGTAPFAVPAQKDGTLVGEVSTSVGSGKEVTVSHGSVVVAPSVDTIINTPVGKIQIGAKSLALVMAFANGLAVYDLDDVRKGAIQITAAGNTITMSPGQHVFITRDTVRNFEDVNPAQMIGYRGITSRNLNNGLKAFSAEFNVPHAVHAVKPLKQLVQSNHPHSKKVRDHLLKTTAAIMQLRGNSGAYQQVFRPRKTAWLQ